ncbi:hypothetical protein BJY01DRAFT_161495 [Aspergillus pseudoustus]|uniref:Uncharacterized protein n=1 Tax=Aspergillus pseudoustus TaxID=1810923 RepID=A0ABR4K776_9EURO
MAFLIGLGFGYPPPRPATFFFPGISKACNPITRPYTTLTSSFGQCAIPPGIARPACSSHGSGSQRWKTSLRPWSSILRTFWLGMARPWLPSPPDWAGLRISSSCCSCFPRDFSSLHPLDRSPLFLPRFPSQSSAKIDPGVPPREPSSLLWVDAGAHHSQHTPLAPLATATGENKPIRLRTIFLPGKSNQNKRKSS